MAQSQYHAVKITVFVLSTHISVKFPCSLHYQLKYQGLIVESTKPHELKQGKSESQQKLGLQIQLQMIKQSYFDTKASLQIIMISPNGKVPAGSVSIPIVENGQLPVSEKVHTKSIDKCPDRLSKISFKLKLQFLGSHRRVKSNHPHTRSTTRFNYNNSINNSNSQLLFIKDLTKKLGTLSHSQVAKSKQIPESKYSYKKLQTERINIQKSIQKVQQSSNNNSVLEKSFDDKQQQNQPFYIERKPNKHKIHHFFAQKSISRPFIEYKGFNITSQQLTKYKNESQQLEFQLNRIKQKYKYMQRKQKEYLQQIRDLREQNEKLRSKSSTNDLNNFQIKQNLQQKQKVIKRLSQQLKSALQQGQELKNNSSIQQKRIDYKQTALNEQIKKLSQKYQQSQNQRQKIMVQMNNKLMQFQSIEKKSQLQFKQKQLAIIEQKNKLLKKIQQQKNQIQHLQEQISTLKAQMQDQIRNSKRINTNRNDIQAELSQIQNKHEQALLLLNKSEDKCKYLQIQLTDVKTQYQKLSGTNKKYVQMSIQYNKLKEEEKKLNKNIESLTKSVKQLQFNLKQSSKGKQSILSRNTQLSKQLLNTRKQLQTSQSQIQVLKQQIRIWNQKYMQLQQNIDNNRGLFDQIKKKMEDEIIYLAKSKEHLENQYESLKWRNQRNQANLQTQRNNSMQLNDKILKLTHQVLGEQQTVKSLQILNKQLQTNISLLKSDISLKEIKQKQLANLLKSRQQAETNTNKIIKDLQQKLTISKQKQLNLIKNLEQEKTRKQKIQKEKLDIQIYNSKDRQQLMHEMKFLLDSKQAIIKQYQHIRAQFQHNQNIKNQLEKKLNFILIQMNQKNRVIKQLQNGIQKRVSQENKLTNINKRLEDQKKIIKAEFQKYKSQMLSCFQKLVAQFCKDFSLSDSGNNSPEKQGSLRRSKVFQQYVLINFPDQGITNIQIKIFQKRTQLYLKYIQVTKQLEQGRQQAAKQLSRVKQNFLSTEKRLQAQIEQQKTKLKQLLTQTIHQKNELVEKIGQLQQKILDCCTEKDRLLMQIKCNHEQMNQIRRNNIDIQAREQQVLKKNSLLMNQVRQLNRKVEHLKKNANSQLLLSNQQYKVTVEKQKSNIQELQKKIVSYMNEASQSWRNKINLQNQLAAKGFEVDKANRQIQVILKREDQYKHTIKYLKQQIQNKQKMIRQQCQRNDVISRELSTQKFKNQDYNIKLNKSKQQIMLIEKQKQNLVQENKNIHLRLQQYESKVAELKKQYDCSMQNNTMIAKQLNQKILQLKSQTQLKEFLYKQIENNYNQSKNNNLGVINELLVKKQQISIKNREIEGLKNQNMVLKQQNLIILEQRDRAQKQCAKLKIKIETLIKQTVDKSIIDNMLQYEHKEKQKFKNEMNNINNKFQALTKQHKQLSNEYKKQLSIRGIREQQYKRKIRELQKQLASKMHQFGIEGRKIQSNIEYERNQYIKNIQYLKDQISRYKLLYENTRQQNRKQLDQAHEQCAELTGLLTQKQQILCLKDHKIKQCEGKIKLLTTELKQCFDVWESEKKQTRGLRPDRNQVKIVKIMDQIEFRSKKLLNKSSTP